MSMRDLREIYCLETRTETIIFFGTRLAVRISFQFRVRTPTLSAPKYTQKQNQWASATKKNNVDCDIVQLCIRNVQVDVVSASPGRRRENLRIPELKAQLELELRVVGKGKRWPECQQQCCCYYIGLKGSKVNKDFATRMRALWAGVMSPKPLDS